MRDIDKQIFGLAIPAVVTTRHTTDALLEEYRASLALLERVIDMLRALPL